jgi:hypothetical protein
MQASSGVTEVANAISEWDNWDGTTWDQDAGSPTYNSNSTAWNFHPIVTFDGNDRFVLSSQTLFAGTDAMTAYWTFNTNDNTNESTMMESGSTAHPAFEINMNDEAGKFGMDLEDTDFDDLGYHTTQTITDDANYLMTSAFDNQAPGNIYNMLNGGNKEEQSSADVQFTIASGAYFHIGSEGNSRYWDGDIPEIIIYNTYMSDATSIAKIHTYLAIKYGVSIDQTSDTDYINTAGTTIWDATTNGAEGYKSNIAGLTLDLATGLDQKIATSANSNDILIMSLDDDFTSSNDDASRTTEFNESDLCPK